MHYSGLCHSDQSCRVFHVVTYVLVTSVQIASRRTPGNNIEVLWLDRASAMTDDDSGMLMNAGDIRY